MKLKSQYKSAKEEIRAKEYEIEEIKRNIKFTRLNEHEIEVKTLQSEIENIKKFYENSLLYNKKQAKVIDELENYKELYFKMKKNQEINENTINNLNKTLINKEDELKKYLISSANSSNRKLNPNANSETSLNLNSTGRLNGKLNANLKLTNPSKIKLGYSFKGNLLNSEKSKKSLDANQTSISVGLSGVAKGAFEPSIHDYTDKINNLKELLQ